ncbi:MAG TPA: aspartyl protease family protein [bacterium]|nr:aspartyl protease family protein [bacterium]
MGRAFPYNRARTPPAPVLPVRIAGPNRSAGAAAPALVDTGADLSVIPAALARDLRLAAVGTLRVRGVTGIERVPLYAVELEVAGLAVTLPMAAIGTHLLIGRDVLNRWTLRLRGPEETLEWEAS